MAGVREWGEARLGVLGVCVTVICASALCATAVASPPRYEMVEQFGPDGTEASGFAGITSVAVDEQNDLVFVADGNAGKLYKFDIEGNPEEWGGAEPYISGNEIAGLEYPEREVQRQVAVDPDTQTVYVTTTSGIRAFQANGEPSVFTAGSGSGTSVIGGFTDLAGLTVDVNGYIYASDRSEGLVKVIAPSGEQVNEFATEEPANLTVDSYGAVYVNRFFGTVTKFTPDSPLPVTAATIYTAASAPVDERISTAVGVDLKTNNLYLAYEPAAPPGTPGIAVYDEDGTVITRFAEPGAAGVVFGVGGVAIDGAAIKVYAGNRPKSGEGLPQVRVFQPEPPAAPAAEELTAGGISNTAATLFALINPNQKATTYYFEYGLNDCSVSLCTAVPLGGASIGSGNDGVWVSQAVENLEAGTQYHYRVVAENELGGVSRSSVFSTQGSGLIFDLSDSRAWELVSPANKLGAKLRGTHDGGGHIQAAADGNGLAYVSVGSVEDDPEGNRAIEASSVLAQRSEGGWRSEDITAPNGRVTPVPVGGMTEIKLFSPDLSEAILDPRSGTALSPEASERAPYLRKNTLPPTYQPLVTGKEGFANVPPGTVFGGGDDFISDVSIQNSTPDLNHVVLASEVPLVEGAPAPSIYKWSEGGLAPISVLPTSEGGAMVSAGTSGSGSVSARNAISSNGSRVFWTGLESPNDHLYLRDMDAEETARIDQVQPDASGAGAPSPLFQGASIDGRIVFFTDSQQLTKDASASGRDLYRCEIIEVEAGCSSLVDLTEPSLGSGESAEVQGVISGMSDDGSRVYFVAEGVLVGGANQFGDVAVSGRPNMYLWQEGVGLRYITTLVPDDDRAVWGMAATTQAPGRTSMLSATTSPSGQYLAFSSGGKLTGQSSIDPVSAESVQRVFRYDAVAGQLRCISCAPNGAAPQGTLILENNIENSLVDPQRHWSGRYVASILPQVPALEFQGPIIYRSRVALDNGRVYFNSVDALAPADSNREWDVYQYEDLGVGGCVPGSGGAGIVRSGDGCVSLMSSGTGGKDTAFLDASVSGNDVFFLTAARLAVTDVDDEVDAYDARVNGVTAVLNPVGECTGGSCRAPTAAVPAATPNSATFTGRGNVKLGKRCAKGRRKVRRSGKQRCVPHRGKKHQRRGQRAATRARPSR